MIQNLLRIVLVTLTFRAALMPTICQAQLVPAGDFRGKTLSNWTSNWGEWAIRSGLAGQVVPNTVDGVRYLPPNFGATFVADVVVEEGTAVVFSPYFVIGESYDDGTKDAPADVAAFKLFENATVRTTLNGAVVLEGVAGSFPERLAAIREFSAPIPYLSPADRGGHNALSAIFEQGLGEIFELPAGNHSLVNVYESQFFGGPFSATYNITVVPEPTGMGLAGAGIFVLGFVHRRRCCHVS